MNGALLIGALCLWSVGAALDLVVGADRHWARLSPYTAGAVGSALVCAVGVRTVLGRMQVFDLGTTLGFGHTLVRLDPLAGLFLTLAGGLGVAISCCFGAWAHPPGRLTGHGTGAAYMLVLGAVVVIIVAGDAFTFLFAWEALTVAFYALAGIRHERDHPGRPAWITLGIGKIGGAALLLGFLLLAGTDHNTALSAWTHVAPSATRQAAFTLIVAGFAAKVGLVPFHGWLPVGYPAAPGPARAAMAGLAANVGFYGLWRFLEILGAPPLWLAVVVLTLGGLTAFGGIVFAAVQARLNRVVAYSSVENAGLILVGYGVALAGAATHHGAVAAIGLLAASLQVLAHAVAKSALYSASAFVEVDYGTDDLEVLRGIGPRHPVSGTAFGLGSLTLAGLPPTIGFVSEWFLLEALLQEFRVHQLAVRLSMAFAGAFVALSLGIAALAFIRLVGLMVLGRPGPTPDSKVPAGDKTPVGAFGLGLVAVPCLGLAAAAPWVIRFMADGLYGVVPGGRELSALRSPWVLQPVFPKFSILSPSWLFVVMPIAFTVVTAATILLSARGLLRVRRVPAWLSATSGVVGPDQYSAFGYSNVLRHVLANVLGSRRSILHGDREVSDDKDHAHVEVETVVVEPVVAYLYRPARVLWLWFAASAKRLQSGRLDAYVGYMLVALLVLLTIVAVMK
jgi:hydrogenase-4 component B